MDINTLVAEVKQGDEVAFKKIMDIHHRLTCKIISSYKLDVGDYRCSFDDLYQEANIALHEACLKFDAEKDTKFSSYAYVVIKGRILNYIRSEIKSFYSEICFSIDSLDCTDYLKGNAVTSVYEDPLKYTHSIDNQETIKNFMDNLSSKDAFIIKMRLADVPYKEIAKKLAVNRKYIDNRYIKIKKQLKKYLEENDLEY